MSETKAKHLSLDDPRILHFVTHVDDLKNRDYIQEFITFPDREMADIDPRTGEGTIETECPIYVGKLVVHEGMFYRVESFLRKPSTTVYTIHVTATNMRDTGEILLPSRTAFVLPPGYLKNFMEGEPIVTGVGLFLLNALILADPFGDIIPYINKRWKSGDLESTVSNLLVNHRITVEQFNVYADNLMFLGHSPEFCSPNLTRKALGTDPKILERKRELLVEYGDALEAGDATVMSRIESELVGMDKDYLKGDEAMNYLLKGKYFDVVRKKLFVIHGMVESFGDKGQFAMIPNSLEEGWTQDAFPTIANEIRAGSYSRAKETAKGGEESKFILRVFQNTRITMDDCGTTRYLEQPIHSGNYSEFVYRNIVGSDGSIVEITQDNQSSFIGHTVRLRSPMYCTAEGGGYCYTCMGNLFKNLQQDVLATVVNSLGASFTTMALKSMHGNSVKTTTITDLNKFVV